MIRRPPRSPLFPYTPLSRSHLVQIERCPARPLPVESERVETVPLRGRDGGVTFLEPQRQAATNPPAQREVGELVPERGFKVVGRSDGQQDDGPGLRERRAFAPTRQTAPGERVEAGAIGGEQQADRAVGERAYARKRRGAVGGLRERDRKRELRGPRHRRDAPDLYGLGALHEQGEER